MELIYSSETSVYFHWTTKRYITQERIINNHRSQNLRCNKFIYGLINNLGSSEYTVTNGKVNNEIGNMRKEETVTWKD
jgi:hypothetical protein